MQSRAAWVIASISVATGSIAVAGSLQSWKNAQQQSEAALKAIQLAQEMRADDIPLLVMGLTAFREGRDEIGFLSLESLLKMKLRDLDALPEMPAAYKLSAQEEAKVYFESLEQSAPPHNQPMQTDEP